MSKMSAKRLYLAALFVFTIAALFYGPISQPQEYHDFADDREFLSIPNALDVMSNLVILYPGLVGLAFVHERRKNSQISDDEAIEEIILTVINENPAQVEAYLAGKDKLFGFFVGQVMKETQGKANPKTVNQLLKEILDSIKI